MSLFAHERAAFTENAAAEQLFSEFADQVRCLYEATLLAV
jgi:hypothetical protein